MQKNFIDTEDFDISFTQLENAAVVIIPVPFDGTSTYGKGADLGPDAILDAAPHLEFYDIETQSEVFRKGIFTAEAIIEEQVDDMVATVFDKCSKYIRNKKMIVLLGGEHSVSIGSIQAHAAEFPNLTVLQFDAHSDMRNEYHGSIFNHACVMARAKELCNVVQVGIRSIDKSELENIPANQVFYAENIRNQSDWKEQMLSKITENVYITIDLDVFDPSIMPSTGTPEPGGMYWYEVIDALNLVCQNRNVVGFDVVELAPTQYNKAPDFMAAKLIYKLLTYKYFYAK